MKPCSLFNLAVASLLLVSSLFLAPSSADSSPWSLMSCSRWSSPGYCQLEADYFKVGCGGHHTLGALMSSQLFYNGYFSVDIKFQAGYTCCINTAFYLIDTVTSSNSDPRHAEIDMEFYGAPEATGIMLATNVFFGGKQNLVQFRLPFDPSADFHTYAMQWNSMAITWYIDSQPIRVLWNGPDVTTWPSQPLLPMFTVWQISWIINGHPPTSFPEGPIYSLARNFNLTGCSYPSSSFTPGATPIRDPCPFLDSPRSGTRLWNQALAASQLSSLTSTSCGEVYSPTLLHDYGWDKAT